MPVQKGVESAIEFTKHVMTLSGAGIAFVATIDVRPIGSAQRIALFAAMVLLALSLAAGLLVWSRAAVMISNQQYSLEDAFLKWPGLVNLFAFGFGVVALGVFIAIKIFGGDSAPTA